MGEARRSKKREIKKRGEEKRKREKKKKRELSQQSYGRRVVVIAWRVCVSIGLVTGARSTSRRKRLVCTRMNAGAFGRDSHWTSVVTRLSKHASNVGERGKGNFKGQLTRRVRLREPNSRGEGRRGLKKGFSRPGLTRFWVC